jgi:hypothetical protein
MQYIVIKQEKYIRHIYTTEVIARQTLHMQLFLDINVFFHTFLRFSALLTFICYSDKVILVTHSRPIWICEA